MPRPSKLWRRAGRAGWWATIQGRQVPFGEDYQSAERAFRAAKGRAEPARPGAPVLVAVAIDRYLDEVQETLAPKTYRIYRVILEQWARRHGRMAVAALDEEHLRRWLANDTWASTTRHHYGAVVKVWARWCRRRKYLAASPFDGVKLPPARPRKDAEAGAMAAVLEAASPEFRDFLTICLETGCRPGEVRTLEAHGIDRERSTAIVCGKTGERLIGLTARALEVLAPLMERHPDGPLLRDERGKPWSDRRVVYRMGVTRGKAGVAGVVTYHCRHAFWSRATKAGVPDIAIAKQLGHKDLSMLHRHYSHADHEIMRETARRAGGEDRG